MPQPSLMILMKGHPGVGKTSLARALAQRLSVPLIDKDDAKDCMPLPRISGSSISHTSVGADVDWNKLSYAIMFRMAETQLELLNGVVVDCPLAKQDLYAFAKDIAVKHAAQVLVVDCFCSDEACWRQRLERRGEIDSGTGSSHKPGTWQEMQELLARYNGCFNWSTDGSVEVDYRIPVDSAKMSPQECLEEVLTFISVHNLVVHVRSARGEALEALDQSSQH